MKCSVLIVEDENSIAELIAVNLNYSGYKILRAMDARQAEILIDESLPDIIILDWMLPGTSGIQFARNLRNNDKTASIPIIILTARSSEEDKIQGFNSGADDYITKPFSPKELIARIKAILRRRSPQLIDEKITFAGIVIEPSTHKVSINKTFIHLGPTEFRLLHFFITNPERVFSRGQLLDSVWGNNVFVGERTVDVHVRRLRKQLVFSGHNENIMTIRGSGYMFTKSPPNIR